MGQYLRNLLNHAKYLAPGVYREQTEPSRADYLRLAKDTFHDGAMAMAGVAIGIEVVGDGPIAHAWALGLGCLALMAEMGSNINNIDLQRELANERMVQANEVEV